MMQTGIECGSEDEVFRYRAPSYLKRDPPIMLSKSLHQKTTDLYRAGYSRLGLFLYGKRSERSR